MNRGGKLRLLACTVAVAVAAVGAETVAVGAINHPVPGVFGTVTATPGCPVNRAGQQCPPRPVQATVRAEQHGEIVASTQSDSAGDYAMGVPGPGTYRIVVSANPKVLRCPAKTARVKTGQSVEVDINCHLTI